MLLIWYCIADTANCIVLRCDLISRCIVSYTFPGFRQNLQICQTPTSFLSRMLIDAQRRCLFVSAFTIGNGLAWDEIMKLVSFACLHDKFRINLTNEFVLLCAKSISDTKTSNKTPHCTRKSSKRSECKSTTFSTLRETDNMASEMKLKLHALIRCAVKCDKWQSGCCHLKSL